MKLNYIMMKLMAVAFVVLFALTNDSVKAQDIHFSENYATPLVINPAFTGIFNGGVRLTGIYRNQWASISKDAPFTTISASAEVNTLGGAFANDRVALGLMIYSDKAGDLDLSTNHINLSFGYQTAFGANDRHWLSFGAMGGYALRSIDYTKARFGNQFDGDGHNGLLPSGEILNTDAIRYMDVGTGLLYYYGNEQRYNFYGGIGFYHINRPKINFLQSDQEDRLLTKTSVQFGGNIPAGDMFDITPSIYYLNQGPYNKVDVGSFFTYIFERKSVYQQAFGLGVFARFGGDEYNPIGTDAIMAALRMDLNELTFGLSYDYNISKLNLGTNGRGAVELAVVYVLQAQKRQKVLHCPRF